MYCNKLRYIRKEKGLTLEELSEKSGLSSGYLCHLEKGSRNHPSIETMEKIIDEDISYIYYINKKKRI